MKCLICGEELTAENNKNNDGICDACEETRQELSNGKGEDE